MAMLTTWPVTKEYFLKLVDEWAKDYDRALKAGQPDFGTELTLEDWMGSFDAWLRLRDVAVLPGK